MVINTDILIIGAGPGGLLSAYLLAKQGYSVHLIEKNPEISRKVCGEYLCPKGVELLKKLNLKGDLLADFSNIEGMKLYPPSGKEVKCFFPRSTQSKFGCSLNRQLFDERLLLKAKSVGVKTHFKTTPLSIDLKNNVSNSVKTNHDTFYFKLLIGADGRNSFVAKSYNLTKKIKDKRLAIHSIVKKNYSNDRLGAMHLFEDKSYIGFDPINEYEVNISLVCSNKKIISNPYEVLLNQINSSKSLKRYAKYVEKDSVNAVYPISHRVKSCIAENMALIGDAAGFIDPLTGEGIYNAIWMANALSEEIVLNKNDLSFNNALKKYQTRKNKYFRQKKLLNFFFQFLIGKNRFMELLAVYLSKNKKKADTFIGIVGNIYSPIKGIYKLLKD